MKALNTLWALPVAATLLAGCNGKGQDSGGSEGPVLSTSHLALDFGAVDFGLIAGKQITIANVGDEDLNIEAVEVTSPWSLDTEVPDVFEPGQSLGVNIGLLGSERGSLEGTLTLRTNDPAQPELAIPLTASISSPPTVSVVLQPAKQVFTNTTVEAVVTIEGDDSNLEVGYAWLVNNQLIDQVVNPSLNGLSHFNKHDTVRVVVNPQVGNIFMDLLQAEVVVRNAQPSDPQIELDPNDAEPGEDILCNVRTESVDADPEDAKTLLYEFSWTVDGADFSGAGSTNYSGDTVPAGVVLPGELWACTLIVTDGDGATTTPKTVQLTVAGAP